LILVVMGNAQMTRREFWRFCNQVSIQAGVIRARGAKKIWLFLGTSRQGLTEDKSSGPPTQPATVTRPGHAASQTCRTIARHACQGTGHRATRGISDCFSGDIVIEWRQWQEDEFRGQCVDE
jgi:hypothetical protein